MNQEKIDITGSKLMPFLNTTTPGTGTTFALLVPLSGSEGGGAIKSRPMDKYVVEKVIGEGTYGIVYKAQEKVELSVSGCIVLGLLSYWVVHELGNWGLRRDQEV
jgi:hypothetical protein